MRENGKVTGGREIGNGEGRGEGRVTAARQWTGLEAGEGKGGMVSEGRDGMERLWRWRWTR